MNKSKFHSKVLSLRKGPLTSIELATLQVNIGYRCNLTCSHCHVGGGPSRTEMMDSGTTDAVLRVMETSPIKTLDITGGAPELNPHFRRLVMKARQLGKRVIVRTNLAVFSDAGMSDLPEFYRDHDVELVASLPCYLEQNVDQIRGSGTHGKCIAALQKLNGLGFGEQGGRTLNLVYNPAGPFLAPPQDRLEQDYRRELRSRHGISFNRLYTFTNMPIGRFRDHLVRTGDLERYADMLSCAFNPATLDGIMCRHLISVGWDGRLFDCDFNQILGITVNSGAPAHIRDFSVPLLSNRTIEIGDHCFGCTAGQGST